MVIWLLEVNRVVKCVLCLSSWLIDSMLLVLV